MWGLLQVSIPQSLKSMDKHLGNIFAKDATIFSDSRLAHDLDMFANLEYAVLKHFSHGTTERLLRCNSSSIHTLLSQHPLCGIAVCWAARHFGFFLTTLSTQLMFLHYQCLWKFYGLHPICATNISWVNNSQNLKWHSKNPQRFYSK